MQGFTERNPVALTVYYLSITVPMMFCMDPVLLTVGFFSGFSLLLLTDRKLRPASLLLYFLIPPISAVLNGLMNHGGVTVLFVLNDNPVTKEALLYGLTAGLMLSAVLLWFRSFSAVMTTDKLLYVFSRLSPKLALILSMTLRYIPLYRRQAQKTREANRAIGLMSDDSFLDRLRGGLRVFSAMVTWALENGVVTADSMTARGYGSGKRTRFSLFFWHGGDTVLTVFILLAAVGTALAMAGGYLGYTWYPRILSPAPTAAGIGAYVLFALAAFLPSILEGGAGLRWRSFVSQT